MSLDVNDFLVLLIFGLGLGLGASAIIDANRRHRSSRAFRKQVEAEHEAALRVTGRVVRGPSELLALPGYVIAIQRDGATVYRPEGEGRLLRVSRIPSAREQIEAREPVRPDVSSVPVYTLTFPMTVIYAEADHQ